MDAAKAKLGVKRRCLTCATAFLDLNRTPIVCPKCGSVFQVIEYPRSPRRAQAPLPQVQPLAQTEEADAAEEVEADDDGENAIPEIEDEDNEIERDAAAELKHDHEAPGAP